MKKVSFPQAFAAFIMTMVFAYFFIYSFSDLTEAQRVACRDVVIAIIGVSTTVMGFIYGSSYSSAKKDDALAAMGTQPATTIQADSIDTLNTGDAAATIAEWQQKRYAKGERVTYKGMMYEAGADIVGSGTEPGINPDWKAL